MDKEDMKKLKQDVADTLDEEINIIKGQIKFVLEDDNEIMQSSLNDDELDEENKQMNIELIREHGKIINKIDLSLNLTREDLELIRDANEIHLNDEDDYNGHHKEAKILNEWINQKLKCLE